MAGRQRRRLAGHANRVRRPGIFDAAAKAPGSCAGKESCLQSWVIGSNRRELPVQLVEAH